MRLRFLALLALLGVIYTPVIAQDIHFTYFQMAPLTLNPGLTGAFEGTFRVGGIYRGQWSGDNGFATPTIYVDAPILAIGKTDWIGVGIGMTDISIFGETAGTANFGINSQYLSLAYHRALDKKRNSVISFGLQYGSISKRLKTDNGLIFRSNIIDNNVSGLSPELSQLIGFTQGQQGDSEASASGGDLNLGIYYRSLLNKKSTVKLGIMAAHILSPNLGFVGAGGGTGNPNPGGNNIQDADMGMRITAFGQLTNYLNAKLRFEPAFYFQNLGSATEIGLQGMLGYLMDPRKGIVLNAGLGYRVGDAAELLMGFEKGDLRAGLSFDVPLTGVQSVPGFQNGFEIAIGYIFKIYKKPNVKPVIFCPRF